MPSQPDARHSPTPYLSVVTYVRNDGYTSDYEKRVLRATRCLVHQLTGADLDCEVILVEWNPRSDRPLILDQFKEFKSRNVTVRGYVVPTRYHDRYLGSREGGLHIDAPNVGLRRARGRFLLPKASDTFLSKALVETLASKTLDERGVYRCDRFDVEVDMNDYDSVDDETLLSRLEVLEGHRCGRLKQPEHWRVRDLHTNACGDFTLMSRQLWSKVRGYPADKTTLSLDLDSLLLHLAVASGGEEICLPDACRVIKPVHSRLHSLRTSQVWKPWQQKLDRYLERKYGHLWAHRARMLLDYPRRQVRHIPSVLGPSAERNLVWPASRWASGAKPRLTQGKDWGLANEPLEERILCRAAWDNATKAAA